MKFMVVLQDIKDEEMLQKLHDKDKLFHVKLLLVAKEYPQTGLTK